MRIDIISFTLGGAKLSIRLAKVLGEETGLYYKGSAETGDYKITRVLETLGDWTKKRFEEHVPIVFIGALGIAVRSIAPFIEDKLKDIPVVCVDEAGRFSIPVLSSHYGGGLYIAKRIAEGIGAQCVMTTATDINGRFAVDVFAAKNNLIPANKEGIKAISSRILAGQTVSIFFENLKTDGELPEELRLAENADMADIVVSNRTPTRRCSLQLIPLNLHLGVGCKKGKNSDEILRAVRSVLSSEGYSIYALQDISSIDIKKDEKGLADAAAALGVQFLTYTSKELGSLEGDYCASAFVKEITGVDNVCERSAVLSSGQGSLVIGKRSLDGVTVAAAVSEYRISF